MKLRAERGEVCRLCHVEERVTVPSSVVGRGTRERGLVAGDLHQLPHAPGHDPERGHRPKEHERQLERHREPGVEAHDVRALVTKDGRQPHAVLRQKLCRYDDAGRDPSDHHGSRYGVLHDGAGEPERHGRGNDARRGDDAAHLDPAPEDANKEPRRTCHVNGDDREWPAEDWGREARYVRWR
jgi:hypothetical protein